MGASATEPLGPRRRLGPPPRPTRADAAHPRPGPEPGASRQSRLACRASGKRSAKARARSAPAWREAGEAGHQCGAPPPKSPRPAPSSRPAAASDTRGRGSPPPGPEPGASRRSRLACRASGKRSAKARARSAKARARSAKARARSAPASREAGEAGHQCGAPPPKSPRPAPSSRPAAASDTRGRGSPPPGPEPGASRRSRLACRASGKRSAKARARSAPASREAGEAGDQCGAPPLKSFESAITQIRRMTAKPTTETRS